MKRISLTDGSGKWFDLDKAEKFEENSYHNGNNWISKATGSQWHHENIYLTASGVYVLNTWSNFQGVPETFEQISQYQASRWFAKQSFNDDEIPEELKQQVSEMEI